MTRARVLAAILLALVAAAASTEAARTSSACPVTVPKQRVTPGFTAAGFNYGTKRLRAHIWRNGILVAGRLPDGGYMATIEPDGSISAKLGWWRGVPGKLRISGRRVDRTAPPLRAHVPDGYGSLGFVPSALTFPSVGCWRVTGRVGSASLSFVVKVIKRRSS